MLDLLGVGVVRLTDSELRTANLASLDTILIDIRALGHRPPAIASLHRLVEFARQRGRLVVLYHKDQEFNLRDK